MNTATEATFRAVYAELKIVLADWIRTGETTPSGAELCRGRMANRYEFEAYLGATWPSVGPDSSKLDPAALDAGRARLGLNPKCASGCVTDAMGVPEGGGLACLLVTYLDQHDGTGTKQLDALLKSEGFTRRQLAAVEED